MGCCRTGRRPVTGQCGSAVWRVAHSLSRRRGRRARGRRVRGGISVKIGANPALLLDPSLVGANASSGVNQLVALIADQTTAVQAGFAEVSYSPLYLEPRWI
jgi:hypothetical protein